jgi:predicted nucleotidyltransferase component of viral defense system
MTRYATPAAFKEALEARLRTASRETGRDQNRLRMRLVMDRLATRITEELGEAVVLKGGVVLELRLAEARATKDLDLHLIGDPALTLDRLRRAGRRQLADHLTFEIQMDARHPTIDCEGTRYEGQRFVVLARMAGKPYGGPFGVDVAFAEPMVGEPELLGGSNFLAFADIPAPVLRAYPLETHIAEKLHAYTMPRPRPNSRVKDLPDMALLARVRPIDAQVLRHAIEHTFHHRAVHAVPEALPAPAEAWRVPYGRIASSDRLRWPDLDSVTEAVRGFMDPVLLGHTGTWDPTGWTWTPDDAEG